jgi:hypothetical protein
MGGNQKSLIQEESGKSDAIIIAEVAVVLVFVIACLILFVALRISLHPLSGDLSYLLYLSG